MCSSTAFFKTDDSEEQVLEEVMHLEPQGTGYKVVGLLGDEKILDPARLIEVDFENNRIVFGPPQ